MIDTTATPEGDRIAKLTQRFAATFGQPPTLLVRAPGRVNLLGEHTDYNGLPVLPMAIDRSVWIAAGSGTGSMVRLRNVAPSFEPRDYELTADLPPYAAGDWGNYHKAAAHGLWHTRYGEVCRGGNFLVDGDIPAGAGLSSSSALVVASALALLGLNQVTVPARELAELLPLAERYVGTMSGGMDQAISLLAVAGQALRIDFFPLRVRPVPLAHGYSVVVCHSLVTAEKSGRARLAYNLRVVEGRLATRVYEVALAPALPRALTTLGDLARLFPGRSLAEFLPALEARLPPRPLSLGEIATAVGTSPTELRNSCQIAADLGDQFAIVRRARHVLTEAERVERAERLLAAGDVTAFGALMDASHASCRDDYEISCPEVEDLVAIAKEAGAVGARITGAGFGGCVVALVEQAGAPAFIQSVDRRFYRPRLGTTDSASSYRFVFNPCGGATTRRLTGDAEPTQLNA